jgi:hypothetical protein
MRDSHQCPKCHHGEVLYLPELTDQAEAPAALHAVVRHHLFRGPSRWGRLTAYICRACGYTELYTESPAAIPIDQVPGAAVLTPATKGGPYRDG